MAHEEYLSNVFGQRQRIVDALGEAREAQDRVLRTAIEANAGTAFGREHGFERIRTVDDFRAAVPIGGYDAFEPWIARAAEGESGVLTADDPLAFFTSSGSTGAHKKIPVTPGFVRDCFLPFLFAAFAGVIEHHPDVVAETATFSLKHDPGAQTATTASGRPHLGASQLDYARFGPGFYEPGTKGPWGDLPEDLVTRDTLERLYHRTRIAAEHDLRAVVGINPAQVAAWPWLIDRWWPDIVREIHDGTLGGKPHGAPNPERAAELERLAAYHGTLRPGDIWPSIEVIVCWPTGLATLYLPRLREEFGPGVRVHPAPVAASEGPIGLPLDRHPTAGPLVVSSVFYEFVPADEALAPDAATLLFDELEEGGEYHVLLTHVGGFSRYAVGDVIRVVGSLGGVPRVEYAGRNVTSSAAGENLRESHVVRALAAACGDTGIDAHNATPRLGDGAAAPRYEVALAPRTPMLETEAEAFTRAYDGRLGQVAPGYRAARERGALAAPQLHVTAPDAFLLEWERRVEAGNRPPQVKDRVFWSDPDGWERIVARTAAAGVGAGA